MANQPASLLPDPWQVDPGDFPNSASQHDKLLFLLNYAVLAPSVLNTQPWQFELSDDAIAVYADPHRGLAVVDPEGRQRTIGCGAALFNLRTAAKAFGYELEMGEPSRNSDPALIAKLELKASAMPPSELDLRLRDAIANRRTVRSSFENRPLGDALLRDLEDAARQEGAECHFAQSPEHKQQVAELVAEAEQLHLDDPVFRNELRDWLGQRRGEDHDAMREAYSRMGSPAGHTPGSRDHPDQFTPTAAATARQFANVAGAANRQRATVEASPLVALLATADDSDASWLAAGQALQHILLTATIAGVSASYLNPPIELAQLRDRLAQAFATKSKPQVLLRLGYGQASRPTPRRPMSEVVRTPVARK
jgi:nitroreductase